MPSRPAAIDELQPAGPPASNGRVLMIAFHFPPANTTGANRPYRFAKYLEPLGFETEVVTAAPQDASRIWEQARTAPAACPSLLTQIGSTAGRLLQRVLPYNDQLPWVSHAVAVASERIRQHRPAAILSTSPPVACHLAAFFISRIYGIPWIADFRDPIRGNPFRARKWGGIWDVPVDYAILRSAAAVIANTDAAAAAIARRYPGFSEKIHLIWNGYDPEHSVPAPPCSTPRRRKVLLHAGSLYGQRHPKGIISSLHRLLGAGRIQSEDVCLNLLGSLSTNDQWVGECAFQALLDSGCLTYSDDVVSQADALGEMAAAEYLLLLDVNDTGAALQVPAKIFEYIRIGRPILAFTAAGSPVERILAKSGVRHVCVNPGHTQAEVDDRVSAFLRLSPEPATPSAWFHQEFDGRLQARTLAGIIQTVSRQPGVVK